VKYADHIQNSVSMICINSEDILIIYQIICLRSRQYKETTENALNDRRFENKKLNYIFIFSLVNLKSYYYRKFDIFMKLDYKM
jgi:hypothetical protein